MLRIQYFASIRETLGRSEEELELPAQVGSVQDSYRSSVEYKPKLSKGF